MKNTLRERHAFSLCPLISEGAQVSNDLDIWPG